MTSLNPLERTLKFLLVAEHSGYALSIAHLLEEAGIPPAHLVQTEGLPDAQALREHQPQAVLFDCRLLNRAGSFSFTDLLAAAGPVPVIALVGETAPGQALEMIRMGAEDALVREQVDARSLLRSVEFGIERRRSRLQVTDSRDKLEMIARVAHDVLWEWDLVTNEILRDPTYLGEVFGPAAGQGHGQLEERMRMVHPDDRKKLELLVEEIRHNPRQDIYEAEYRVENGSGGYLFIFDRGLVLRDAHGKPVKLVGAAQNITARKQAEEQLRQSEEKFKLIFNSNPFPVWVYDAESLQLLEVNETALRVYGYSREEFLGLNARDLRPAHHVDAFEQEVQVLLQTGKPRQQAYTHQKKNGQEILVEVHAYLFDFLGKRAVLVLANDITNETRLRHELEEQENRRKQEISQAVVKAEEKERTAIGLELHDNVNQILASARLYNELAVKGEGLHPEYTRKCTKLIDDAISEIRQLSQALIAPNFSSKGLLEAIGEIGLLVQETRGIRVDLDAPEFPEEKLDQGKKLTLFRMVQEQVNNILKHAEASFIRIRLALDKSGCVRLEIADNGKGFDVNAKRKGVGLSNIRNRASFYNGRMKVVTRPGSGCRIQVSFRLNA